MSNWSRGHGGLPVLGLTIALVGADLLRFVAREVRESSHVHPPSSVASRHIAADHGDPAPQLPFALL